MDLIADLELINLIDESQYETILATYTGTEENILNRTFELKRLASSDSSGEKKALLRFINFLADVIIEARDYEEALDHLDNSFVKFSETYPSAFSGWQKLKSSLHILENYFLIRKTERIQNDFSRVTGFRITTDARPVYDLRKKDIKRFVYPLILKIESSDNKTFLCEFYEDTLDELIEELRLAKAKVDTLKLKIESN